MALGQDFTIDAIPGGRNAVNYILKVVADFQRVPQRLSRVQAQAMATKHAADMKNDSASSAQAAQIVDTVVSLQQSYAGAAAQLGDVMNQLQQSGVLSGMFDTIVSAIGTAAQVQMILSGVNGVEKQTQQLAVSVMGSQQAAAFNLSGGSLSKYLLYGGLLYVGLWALKKSRGTRRW